MPRKLQKPFGSHKYREEQSLRTPSKGWAVEMNVPGQRSSGAASSTPRRSQTTITSPLVSRRGSSQSKPGPRSQPKQKHADHHGTAPSTNSSPSKPIMSPHTPTTPLPVFRSVKEEQPGPSRALSTTEVQELIAQKRRLDRYRHALANSPTVKLKGVHKYKELARKELGWTLNYLNLQDDYQAKIDKRDAELAKKTKERGERERAEKEKKSGSQGK
ncbi:hypothetical protein KEM55_005237 [Ascosphaera atra]|nr:hypothetical protein KEM55_005237 [Ascosphaera atra]